MTYYEAFHYCLHEHNSKLAEPSIFLKQILLVGLIEEFEWVLSSFWIGATDLSNEGHYEWESKVDMDFMDFGGGKPDGSNSENCLGLSSSIQWKWDDFPCQEAALIPICEANYR